VPASSNENMKIAKKQYKTLYQTLFFSLAFTVVMKSFHSIFISFHSLGGHPTRFSLSPATAFIVLQ